MEWKCELLKETVQENVNVACMLGRHTSWFYGTVKTTSDLLKSIHRKGLYGKRSKDLSKYDFNIYKETRFKSLASFRGLENRIRFLNADRLSLPRKKQKLVWLQH